MKYKILALSVVSAFLGGCGSDGTNSSYETMAYDPAIVGMKGTFSCDNGVTGLLEATNYEGISKITEATVVDTPETCAFTYNKTPGAQDVSNGKDMSNVSYKFPKGLATVGKAATASPLSTLIEKKLDGQPYNESTGSEVLVALGFSDLLNNGGVSSVNDLLRNPEEVIKTLDARDASRVSAITAVLSDVLVVSSDKTVAEISNASFKITEAVMKRYPDFPKKTGGGEIYLDLAKNSSFIEGVVNNPEADVTIPPSAEQESQPVPDPDGDNGGTGGTGGTNGSGGGSNGGSTGG